MSEDLREAAQRARAEREARLTDLGVPTELWRYVDADGLLTEWPARKQAASREAALDYLASLFDETLINEPTVNDLLRTRHTFNDPALLRRELFDTGRLERNLDGTGYRRKTP